MQQSEAIGMPDIRAVALFYAAASDPAVLVCSLDQLVSSATYAAAIAICRPPRLLPLGFERDGPDAHPEHVRGRGRGRGAREGRGARREDGGVARDARGGGGREGRPGPRRGLRAGLRRAHGGTLASITIVGQNDKYRTGSLFEMTFCD